MTEQHDSGVGQAEGKSGCAGLLGGLAVIGTELAEARRIDRQLIGRSGRQGQPGVHEFWISADDCGMPRLLQCVAPAGDAQPTGAPDAEGDTQPMRSPLRWVREKGFAWLTRVRRRAEESAGAHRRRRLFESEERLDRWLAFSDRRE